MGYRNRIRIRFLITTLVLILLGRSFCSLSRSVPADVEMDATRDNQPGLCPLGQNVWFPPNQYKSALNQERNDLQSTQDALSNPTFKLNWMLKYIFPKGEPLKDPPNGLYYQNLRRKGHNELSHWTHKSLAEDIPNELNALILLLLIAYIAIQEADASCLVAEKETSLKNMLFGFVNFICPEEGSLGEDPHTAVDKIKKKWNLSWMIDPLRHTGHFIKYNVYTVLDRVASYREFAPIKPTNGPPEVAPSKSANGPSVLALAEAGFSYTGVGLTVECHGCRNQVEFKDFVSPAIEARYHREGCNFVKIDTNETSEEVVDDTEETHTERSTEAINDEATSSIIETDGHDCNMGSHPTPIANENTLLNQVTKENANLLNQVPDNEISSVTCCEDHYELPVSEQKQRNETKITVQQNENETTAVKQQQRNEAKFNIQKQTDGATSLEQQPRNLTTPPAQQQTLPPVSHEEAIGACAAPERFLHLEVQEVNAKLCDLEEFEPEAESSLNDKPDPKNVCAKNPGHFANFPIQNLNLEHIPRNVKHSDVLDFFKLVGKLVVRVVVKSTSRFRPKKYNIENKKFRFGTGLAIVKSVDKDSTIDKESSGKWGTVRKYIPGIKNKGYVYIETVRHLVYDEHEAQDTTVEFFYDDPKRSGVVFAKGVSIEYSKVLADSKVILKCKISDLSVVEFVNKTHSEIRARAERFPKNIKEGLMKRVFVISHPHGSEKMLSYGEYVMVKYALKMDKQNKQNLLELTKINNHTQISQNHDEIRKVLFYTADTCKGCSGAVIISFQKKKVNNNETITLDFWMHCGVSKKHKLNASTMKELTIDDIANHGTTTVSRPSIQDELEMEADSAANREVSCPVYTVMGSPSHPAYARYMKRLESYPNPFNHVHKREELADAGFFFGGYSDCVRCFHCGLGLRSWKPGDSIYEEHYKNRPDCMFLLMKMRAAGIDQLGFQSHQQQRTPASAVSEPAATTTTTITNEDPKLSMMVQQPVSAQSSQGASTEINRVEAKLSELRMNSMSVAQQVVTVGDCLNQAEASPDISERIAVVEKEQKYLKELLICKVCFKNPAKDLFLPCGELLACLECSKLLTHCPSCNTKILATVTTFFI